MSKEDLKVFSESRDILAGAEKADAAHQRHTERKCDWDDPTDVALYRSELRGEDRQSLLDALVPDRYCPLCQQLFIESRQWVLSKNRTKAMCRSCYQTRLHGEGSYSLDIFSNPELRYTVDGKKLVESRQALGVSQRKFAEKAGWSHGYQHKLESGPIRTVSAAAADTVIEVLQYFKAQQDSGN